MKIWLPCVSPEIISRDRAGAYAEGARQGAPQAVQVADRWHLLKNLREMLERVLTRYHQAIRQVTLVVATTPGLPMADGSGIEAVPVVPGAVTRVQREQTSRRERRLARYGEVLSLHQAGLPVRAIAQRLRIHRRTVRRFIRADRFPERAAPRSRPSQLDGYRGYLRQRWEAGCHNATMLWRELRAQGFHGCRTSVNQAIQPWRRELPDRGQRFSENPLQPRQRPLTIPSPRRISGWLLEWGQAADEDTHTYQQAFVERLCAEHPPIQTARGIAREFVHLLNAQQSQGLSGWLEQALQSGLPEGKGFAQGLQQDQAAVAAALNRRGVMAK